MRPQPYVWWANDPGVFACPLCGCPLQPGPKGNGVTQHNEVVHPEIEGPR